jgi:hypothetical protein
MKPFFLLIGAVLPVSLEKGLPRSANRTLSPNPFLLLAGGALRISNEYCGT